MMQNILLQMNCKINLVLISVNKYLEFFSIITKLCLWTSKKISEKSIKNPSMPDNCFSRK